MVAAIQPESRSFSQERVRIRARCRPCTPESAYPRNSQARHGRRYYNPSTGRWLNRDPLGELGTRASYHAESSRLEDQQVYRILLLSFLRWEGSSTEEAKLAASGALVQWYTHARLFNPRVVAYLALTTARSNAVAHNSFKDTVFPTDFSLPTISDGALVKLYMAFRNDPVSRSDYLGLADTGLKKSCDWSDCDAGTACDAGAGTHCKQEWPGVCTWGTYQGMRSCSCVYQGGSK